MGVNSIQLDSDEQLGFSWRGLKYDRARKIGTVTWAGQKSRDGRCRVR